METISSYSNRVLIRLEQKTQIRKESASEMSFENVDGQMPAYTISSPMSLWLR